MARVAVVGSGLAGFTAYQTLRRALEPGEIAVFGTDADPAAAWRVRARAIRQREMRSESDGHTCATSFPGLAFSSVRRRRSVRPLLDSVLDRYHPSVDEFLSHVERLRERSGWDESLVARRVERVQAVDGGFDLDGERFAHVLLAPNPTTTGASARILSGLTFGSCIVAHTDSVIGIPELTHGSNCLMAADGPGLARETLTALRDAPLRERLGDEARHLYESSFSPPAAAGRLVVELERLAAAGST